MADEGYVIVQKALKDTGKVGVGQFILRGHGNIVAIKPFGKGLILEVLRHANEIRASEPIFKDEYTEAVGELINAKLEHRKPEIATEVPGTAKVINIMDALKKSVQQGKG